MKPETFKALLENPNCWRQKAASLRVSGDALWDTFLSQLKLDIQNPQAKLHNDEGRMLAFDVLWNCQFLYSLSAECGLKGLLIKRHPELLKIETTLDESGNVVSADIKKGDFHFKTHSLEVLARKVGILDEPQFHDMPEILAYGTDVITWSGRYPVPLANDNDFKRRYKLPSKAFGYYFRDWFDPFLDRIFNELATGSPPLP